MIVDEISCRRSDCQRNESDPMIHISYNNNDDDDDDDAYHLFII